MKRKKQNINNNNSLWSKKEIKIIKIAGLTLFLGILWLVGSLFWQDLKKQQQLEKLAGTELKHSSVCMAGNNIKLNELKVTFIDNHEYWICCAKCETKLKFSPKIRYALDPVTNKVIDKSNAVIMQHPTQNEKVLYFESKRNLDIYRNKIE